MILMRRVPYLAFLASFTLLLTLIYVAGVLHSLILIYLPPYLRALAYSLLLVLIVCIWSVSTYKIFRVIERRGLNISQDKR